MKTLIAILIIFFLWIHISPQFVFLKRAINSGNEYCVKGFTLNYEWSWWSLRFYDIYARCE